MTSPSPCDLNPLAGYCPGCGVTIGGNSGIDKDCKMTRYTTPKEVGFHTSKSALELLESKYGITYANQYNLVRQAQAWGVLTDDDKVNGAGFVWTGETIAQFAATWQERHKPKPTAAQQIVIERKRPSLDAARWERLGQALTMLGYVPNQPT